MPGPGAIQVLRELPAVQFVAYLANRGVASTQPVRPEPVTVVETSHFQRSRCDFAIWGGWRAAEPVKTQRLRQNTTRWKQM